MANPESRIVTRDFVLLFIGNFIVVSVYFLLMTTMAYYAVNSYGVDSALAGLTASIFLVAAVVGRIFTGRLAGMVDSKRLGVIALAVQLAMCALYLLPGSGIVILILIRFVHGLSFGVTNTVLPAMAVERLPISRIGEGTGYFMLSNSLGVGIGPLMSILVVMGFEYRILFMICVGLSIIGLVSVMAVKRTLQKTPKEQCDAEPSGKRTIKDAVGSIVDLSAFKISVFMFIVAFAYSSLNAFINSYAIELGMGMFAPFVFLVYSGTLIITRLVTGRIQDKHGDNWVLYPSIASMGVGLLLAAFVSNPIMLLACGIFMATGFGTCMSVGQVAALKVSTCEETSRTISTFFLLCDTGCGLGPFMLGFVLSGFGYTAMYVLCAFIAFAAVLYYHVVHGRTNGRK